MLNDMFMTKHATCTKPRQSITDQALSVAKHGITTSGALQTAGLSEHAINTRCRPSGPWQRLFGKVVLLRTGEPTRQQLLHAVLAHFGEGAVITGLDALRAHGAELGRPDSPVHVLLPENRRTQCPPNIHAERTTRMPTTVELDKIPFATPARACVDAARTHTEHRAVERILLATLSEDLCALAELETELEHGSQRGTAAVRGELRELSGKLASISEQRARRIAEACRLPRPRWHVPLVDATDSLLTVVSAHWPELDLSWDISPDGHHAAVLRARNRRVLHTPPRLLSRNAAEVRQLLEATYLALTRAEQTHQTR